MDFVLMMTKIFGTLIAGVTVVIGIRHEFRQDGQLTLWGKRTVGIAIAGALIAIFSEITSQFLEQRSTAEAMGRAEKQLTEIRRAVYRFDASEIQFKVSLPPTSQCMTSYIARLETALSERITDITLPIFNRSAIGAIKGSALYPDEREESVLNCTIETGLSIRLFVYKTRIEPKSFRGAGLSPPEHQYEAYVAPDLNIWPDCGKNRHVMYQVQGWPAPDRIDDWAQLPRELIVTIRNCKSARDSWSDTGRIIATTDLDNCQVFAFVPPMGFADADSKALLASAELVDLQLKFGGKLYWVQYDDFERHNDPDTGTNYVVFTLTDSLTRAHKLAGSRSTTSTPEARN